MPFSMATIKPIEAKTIHQIQSGQVIVDLCSVVKELVENGIDAGASNIEVRFKNQGLDAIEVQDNGSGIPEENYESLALKHHTSKLSTYADLESLETFGFRGEALSSLCALSKFSVITCLASDAPKGSKLEFETSGKLRNTSVVAAQKGTTVLVEGLFHSLPVRRRELERNIKREWNKVLGVLNQYACIQTGLKFSVSQQPNKGKRMILFSTKGNQTTRENIVNVFGAKTLTVLIPLDLVLELELTGASSHRPTTEDHNQVKLIRVRGHVSRPAHGEGRQTPDRQMFFVNGRPCGLPQFAKVFNEVYKSYNASQSPFIFADIQLDTHLYDVNVSPDKRTILLHEQTRMLDNLRESLSTLFESQDYAMPTSQLRAPKQALLKRASTDKQETHSLNKNTDTVSSVNNDHSTEFRATVAESRLEDRDMGIGDCDEPQPVHGVGLIGRWAERRSESRKDSRSKDQEDTAMASETHYRPDDVLPEALSPSVVPDNLAPNGESTDIPHRGPDLRIRLQELRGTKDAEITNKFTSLTEGSPEPPIPALAAPSRVMDTSSKRAYTSSSVKRTAPEVATITIGDHTVTSILGSAYKKQRIDNQRSRDSSVRKKTKTSVPVPSFRGRLTQMFASQAERSQPDDGAIAISTDPQTDSENSDSSSEHLFLSDDSEEEEDGDENAADVPNRISKDKHLSQKSQTPEEASEDNLESELPAPTSDSDTNAPEVEESRERREEDEVDEAMDNVESIGTPKDMISDESQKRTQNFVKGSTKRKDATYHLQQALRVDERLIRGSTNTQQARACHPDPGAKAMVETDRLDAEDAEEKLSLTISKSDFEKMKIIGQFNLGFIIASRPAHEGSTDLSDKSEKDDELFIIDQHATDEKYNFERLQASTVVQSQRLVHPKALELTAMEEDTVQQNLEALETNGFIVSFDDSGDQPVGTRCELLSLPLSRETTFSLTDLEELISLLQDHHLVSANTVPRPSKVRKMFAMRACRSSVMIGKSLSTKQMEKLVRHMGELDKPWNCPHGRPTMRHLCGLGAWDDLGWKEGDGFDRDRAPRVNWSTYAREG